MSHMTSVPSIEWGDPPPSRRPTRKWAAELELLKERPGQWARLGTGGSGGHARLVIRHRDYEFTGRRINGVQYLWARYVGGGEASGGQGFPATPPADPSPAEPVESLPPGGTP